MISNDHNWWRHAVIYQVYIRSFADGNGDGLGDINGLRAHLDHIADLGVDAIWINPWYPSPMFDAGYDVVTYDNVEPHFGTMDDAEALISEAHGRGLRVILDVVPNHTSHLHPWFQEALAAPAGSAARQRYIFRDGLGVNGELPPNDWPSCFGGNAWTRSTNPDGTPGQWYLHLFASQQPDRNWEHQDVRDELETALRFWFDRGVDGFRIDVAHSLFKAPGLPNVGELTWDAECPSHPFWDQDRIHDVYRSWRSIADSYDPPRVFVAEAWVPNQSRLARYLRADELHTAFNFNYLASLWRCDDLVEVITSTLESHQVVGAPATWVLSNHDVVRHASRFGRPQLPMGHNLSKLVGELDLALGDRRARAAALLMFALPGGAYVYQGEELGLFEVEDLPDEALQDPTWERTNHQDRGRDGCRVPLPWSGSAAPFGFGPDGVETWLPQPQWFAAHTAEAQLAGEDSMVRLYRQALQLRRSTAALGDGALRWIEAGDDVLAFERGSEFVCMVNFGESAQALPPEVHVVLSSAPLTADGAVPSDVAVWLQRW